MKPLKQFGALFLALVLALALAVPAFAAADDTGFSDVDAGAWYAEAVMYCREHNLMAGTGGSRFAPESNLTRAMLVTVLWRQAGSPVVNYLMQFSDVPEGRWYSEAVRWAASEQLVLGYGDGRFGTEDDITQAQLDVLMGRYTDQPVTQGIPDFAGGSSPSTRAHVAAALMNYSLSQQTASTPSEGTKVLIAYFSATKNTESIANHLDAILDADLYEITPEEPYTSADLNYGDDSSRTSQEMGDPDARPAVSGTVENMEQYEVIFLGYPIWWGQAPRIISTFLESYDLSGKTIVPFCTSASSGIGSSAANLHALAGTAVWLDGQRFSGSTSRSAVETWVNGLDLALTPAA